MKKKNNNKNKNNKINDACSTTRRYDVTYVKVGLSEVPPPCSVGLLRWLQY